MGLKIYDVEVLRGPDEIEGGWNDPFGMGFGTAVVYDYDQDIYFFYGPDDKDRLILDLKASTGVIGFNNARFDDRVMLGNDYDAHGDKTPWIAIDLLEWAVKAKFGCETVGEAQRRFGQWTVHNGSINLNAICKATLGDKYQKIGHGAHAPKLIQAGKWPDVFQYNLHDVRLTRMLYDHVMLHGSMTDGKGQVLPCDFALNKAAAPITQGTTDGQEERSV